jgi:hypothetical protein
MPNDAKLGLVCGVGLVIAIAVVFYRKDAAPRPPAEPASINKPPAPPTDGSRRSAQARATSGQGAEEP